MCTLEFLGALYCDRIVKHGARGRVSKSQQTRIFLANPSSHFSRSNTANVNIFRHKRSPKLATYVAIFTEHPSLGHSEQTKSKLNRAFL